MSEQPREEGTQRFATVLTAEVQKTVVDALRGGAPPEAAAAFAGISRATYFNWLKRGREAIIQANGNAEQIVETDPYANFVVSVDEALSRFIVGTVAAIGTAGRTATDGDWRALAWMLERRFPALFGKITRHEVTGKNGQPIQLEHAIVLDPGALDRLSLERKIQLAEILAEMDGEVIDADEALLELDA